MPAFASDSPGLLAEVNGNVTGFLQDCRRQAGMAWAIRPGMRVRVTRPTVPGVPIGPYVVQSHYVSAVGYGPVVSARPAVLKVTSKTPWHIIPVGDVDVQPDFRKAFDVPGWRYVARFLPLAGIFNRSFTSRDHVDWCIVADAVQDYWSDLEESALMEPACRWAPVAAYGPDAAELVSRIIRNAAGFPPLALPVGPTQEAWQWNRNPLETEPRDEKAT